MLNKSLRAPSFVPKQWAGEVKWMRDLRANAFQQFSCLEWPDVSCEDWYRTPVSRFALQTLSPSPLDDHLSDLKEEPDSSPYCGRLVIRDGRLVERGLNRQVNEKFQVISLYEIIVQHERHEKLANTLQDWLQRGLRYVAHKIVPLHYMMIGTGAVIALPQNLRSTKPFLIQIEENREGFLVSPHLIINAGRLSEMEFLVKIQGTGKSVLNTRCEIHLDEGANLKLTELQNLSTQTHLISFSSVNLSRYAQLAFWGANLGGGIVKAEACFFLEGEGASLDAKGMYLGSNDQHQDLRLTVTHFGPQTLGSVLFKGAVRDRSHAIFQGLIEILEVAKGSHSFLSNKNLILTDGAQADSLPQLRIDNNEVKCSHGSTTGRINEEEIHYLTCRGLTVSQARLLIAEGLFSDVIDSAPVILRQEVEAHVERALADSCL